MTIENPPRLWAFAVRGAIHAAPEEAPLLASVHQGWGASKPQAYVREDVAALERETAVLEAMGDADDGLRRERDALAARVEKLREALSLMVDAESPCGPLAHTIAVFALGTDDTAAGKGVG